MLIVDRDKLCNVIFDTDLSFDLGIVALTFKLLFRPYLKGVSVRCRKLILE